MYNISYREFYDILFEKLHTTGIVGDHFNELQIKFKQYLQTGELNGWAEKGDSFHFASHKFCYDNREDIFNLGYQVITQLKIPVAEIAVLQKLSIYDLYNETIYPKTITSEIDIVDWQHRPTTYELRNKFQEYKNQSLPKGVIKNYERLNFWFLRRKNFLKNKFVKLS
jgi:hypothetical protein